MLPRQTLHGNLAILLKDYPKELTPYAPFLPDSSEIAYITRLHYQFIYALADKAFYPVAGEGELAEDWKRHSDPDDLWNLITEALAELRRAWGRLCDENKRRKLPPPEPPESWTEARNVWRRCRAFMIQIYGYEEISKDRDTEATRSR